MLSKNINNQVTINNANLGSDDNSITTINGNLLIQDSLGNSQTITPTGLLPLINSTFNNIIVNPNYNISESGTGIISQTGTGTNIFKQSQFTNTAGSSQIIIKDSANVGPSSIIQNGSSLSINSVTNNSTSQTSLILVTRNPANGGVALFNGNSTQLNIGNATNLYLTGGTNSYNDYTNTNISGVLSLTNALPPTSVATQPAYTDSSNKLCTTNWTQGAIMNSLMTSYPSLTMPSTNSTTLNVNNSIVLTDGTTTNTLSQSSWTGAIATKNEIGNTTHYLNFSNVDTDSIGWPQKNLSLSCNPAIGNITATTFTGAATQSYLNTSIAIGPNYIPFTTGGTSGAQALSTNSNLKFNASTGALTAISFVGDLFGTSTTTTNVTTISDDSAITCYIPFIKTTAGTSTPLYVDDVLSPFTYTPFTSTITATNFAGTSTNSINSAITVTAANTAYSLVLTNGTSGNLPLLAATTSGFNFNASSGTLIVKNIQATNLTNSPNSAGTGIAHQMYSIITATPVTLTAAQFYTYCVVTPPVAAYVIILPAGTVNGQWISITNLSTAFPISLQYPSGTTITPNIIPTFVGGASVKVAWITTLAKWIVVS